MNILSKSNPEQLFQEVQEWRSELDFYKAELTFFNSLLDTEFLFVLKPVDVKAIDALKESINTKRLDTLPMLTKKVFSCEIALGKLLEGYPVKPANKIVIDHNEVKLQVFRFINEMRILKRKIYRIVERKIAEKKRISAEYVEGSLVL
jgi:hypothetical protein